MVRLSITSALWQSVMVAARHQGLILRSSETTVGAILTWSWALIGALGVVLVLPASGGWGNTKSSPSPWGLGRTLDWRGLGAEAWAAVGDTARREAMPPLAAAESVRPSSGASDVGLWG